MNDLKLEFIDEVLGFDLEQYNQLHAVNTKKFLKIMIRLKNLEGEKFDDYIQNEYKGNTYLFDQKITSKNILILDLNDFSKIIHNLSFHKSSLVRKLYYYDLLSNYDESYLEDKLNELLDVFDFSDDISIINKEVGVEKVFDTLFEGHVSRAKDYLSNTEIIPALIIDYLNKMDLKNAILIVDSSLKFFDMKSLINDERVIILDTNIQYNENTNNIVIFNDEIMQVNLDLLIEKIEFNWPKSIEINSIKSLLQIYLHIILNDEVHYLDKPSDNLVCLYIIVRKLLNLNITLNTGLSYRIESLELSDYISSNLV